METLKNSNWVLHIEVIELITGGNQEFKVSYLAKDHKRQELSFDSVC
jgi:hypothetical protein